VSRTKTEEELVKIDRDCQPRSVGIAAEEEDKKGRLEVHSETRGDGRTQWLVLTAGESVRKTQGRNGSSRWVVNVAEMKHKIGELCLTAYERWIGPS